MGGYCLHCILKLLKFSGTKNGVNVADDSLALAQATLFLTLLPNNKFFGGWYVITVTVSIVTEKFVSYHPGATCSRH